MTAPAELRVSVLQSPAHDLRQGDRVSVDRPARRHAGIRRWLIFAALCVVLCGIVVLPADPAGAAPLSACTSDRGTVVAVDFAHWGGPIARGCGIDQPSGYALLHAAGFTTAGDAHDGAAFICRIGNQAFDDGTMHPTAGEDPCIGTPSTSAYWSYWLAPAGQNRWTYSPVGPAGDLPKPGEVELWMFGATDVGGTRGSGVPRFPPSTLRAAKRAPTTRTSQTPSTRPTPSTSPTPRAAPSSSTTAPTTATRAAPAPVRQVRTAHRPVAKHRSTTARRQPRRQARQRPRAPGPRPQASADSAPIVSAQPTSERTSSGSVGPLVVGLCLALALASGAAWAVRRRRRYE